MKSTSLTMFVYGVGNLKVFETEARLNNILEFSAYRKENTTLHHYKDQLVNAV
jgi:hypothetical protein